VFFSLPSILFWKGIEFYVVKSGYYTPNTYKTMKTELPKLPSWQQEATATSVKNQPLSLTMGEKTMMIKGQLTELSYHTGDAVQELGHDRSMVMIQAYLPDNYLDLINPEEKAFFESSLSPNFRWVHPWWTSGLPAIGQILLKEVPKPKKGDQFYSHEGVANFGSVWMVKVNLKSAKFTFVPEADALTAQLKRFADKDEEWTVAPQLRIATLERLGLADAE